MVNKENVKPTGDPEVPEAIRLAIEISNEIEGRVGCCTLDDASSEDTDARLSDDGSLPECPLGSESDNIEILDYDPLPPAVQVKVKPSNIKQEMKVGKPYYHSNDSNKKRA